MKILKLILAASLFFVGMWVIYIDNGFWQYAGVLMMLVSRDVSIASVSKRISNEVNGGWDE